MEKGLLKFFLIALFYFPLFANAQTKTIKGEILDKQSDEPIPFASVKFLIKGTGKLTDSLGRFTLSLDNISAGDSLQITSVGYTPLHIAASDLKDSAFITVQLILLPPQHEVVVKTKYNRALWFWRKIIAHKPENDKRHFSNYSYEVYNKLELDLDNVNKEKLGKNFLLKKLNFVLDYVDSTSEKEPYLPVYLTETLSDYYYQHNPRKTREVIKATITNGIDNESIIKQLGVTYQNVDVYDNSIPVFNKTYV
ncbi:MAG: carboxypeptidase-like regulatory domain-containing protein, partial [Parafilimonas sp.]